MRRIALLVRCAAWMAAAGFSATRFNRNEKRALKLVSEVSSARQ